MSKKKIWKHRLTTAKNVTVVFFCSQIHSPWMGGSWLWHRIVIPAWTAYVAWRAGRTTICRGLTSSPQSGTKNLATGGLDSIRHGMLSEEYSVLINIQSLCTFSKNIFICKLVLSRIQYTEYSTYSDTVKEQQSAFCTRSGILGIILVYLFKTEHSCVCYALESIMYNYK